MDLSTKTSTSAQTSDSTGALLSLFLIVGIVVMGAYLTLTERLAERDPGNPTTAIAY